MKVIAKYKRVEITFNKELVSLSFSTVKDALVFTDWYKKASRIRERACTDKSYPAELYAYLKNKGIINKDLFECRQRMLRKAHLLNSLTSGWM
ncbi:hypothetical protein K2895_001050 [Shigella sonnei]|uniref:Uncharacterized protein n=1 Tax=Escherichia coli TaxID=562 RepID=A0A1V2GC78_ECOLX|nr:hypothetical protein [Escherichia coli]EAB8175172.1 hypothetical protein [Salmonella enterica subsp. enterica serovar Enteritidis]EDW6767783.1 hypothetical protein [Salmonella enterica subsp. enterica serovar Johannesburg]EFV9881523.1 hypothetical protein [Shigella sonnei]EKJ2619649.1 hypothetical protein [Shigella flexneri]HBN2914246.1 hypothetical protein [Escherichia coli O25b:H4-ST131]